MSTIRSCNGNIKDYDKIFKKDPVDEAERKLSEKDNKSCTKK